MIKLVVFLGNPGSEYSETRHNFGWLLADNASFLSNIDWQKKFKGLYMKTVLAAKPCYFLKPQRFMNLSGGSVQALLNFFKIAPPEMLVVHDDLALKFGEVGIKKGGGLGGHNGLRSIVSATGQRDFYRFRLGISRPNHPNVSAYVLSKFSTDEQAALPIVLKKAAAILESCLANAIESAEAEYRKVNLLG